MWLSHHTYSSFSSPASSTQKAKQPRFRAAESTPVVNGRTTRSLHLHLHRTGRLQRNPKIRLGRSASEWDAEHPTTCIRGWVLWDNSYIMISIQRSSDFKLIFGFAYFHTSIRTERHVNYNFSSLKQKPIQYVKRIARAAKLYKLYIYTFTKLRNSKTTLLPVVSHIIS